MKFQFKKQSFQTKAVESVVQCFEGQKLQTHHFTLERSARLIKKAEQLATTAVQLEVFSETELEENLGYRNSNIQITDQQLLENIQRVQRENNLIENRQLDVFPGNRIGPNLTIEMETGTGKTYTYIKTMYELFERYGWNKFIIVVPSIAIREGVYKTFKMTLEHFKEIYGYQIRPFIYNSSRPQDIETFASDARISVMIINTQAFASRSRAARRIYLELDQFGTRKPIDIIAQTRPILIIDEPQSVGRKDSVTMQKLAEFHPLFTLRYSATHVEVYNKIYRLDALDAYSKKLVKKIQVKGINLRGSTGTGGYLYLEYIGVSTDKPPYALVEFETRTKTGVKRIQRKLSQGDDLYQLSGELAAYKNWVITEINGYHNKIVINGEDIYPGDVLNDVDELVFRRIQIRETILSHLEKEKMLYEKGIKVLSLFFIDSVEKYRRYNEMGEAELGEYAQIFEEEYQRAVNQFIDLFQPKYTDFLVETDENKVHKSYAPGNYLEYLKHDKADKVHNGYFSIDKKGIIIDPKMKQGSGESDDVSAYDLIMKDKERLLSFDEPTRFIFSHSALKEGWDNPNVFQICVLKNVDSGSETRRRQEVGRGMRLCVNKSGIRQDFELIGDQVQEINRLTVVASESYENFAKGLQKEIADSIGDRPIKADSGFFYNRIIENERGLTLRINREEATKLNKFLYKNDVLDEDDRITPIGKELIDKGAVPVPEHLKEYTASLSRLMQSIYNGEMPRPENERGTVNISPNQNFSRKEFMQLWNRINKKTVYEVHFDTPRLIEESIIRINADLHVTDRVYEIKKGDLEGTTKQEMRDGTAIYITETKRQRLKSQIYGNTRYDVIGEIEKKTNLKRSTLVSILKGIKQERFLLLQQNPEEFIARSAILINETKASLIINNIRYHKIDDEFDAKTVFTNDINVLRTDRILAKHIYDYLIADSKIEEDFAKNLEAAKEVIVYAKLPKTFYISTPVAKYSPDWAIVVDKGDERHIYFVAETKGSIDVNQLRTVERLKIFCAKEHFKTIAGNEVKFDTVSDFEQLRRITGL